MTMKATRPVYRASAVDLLAGADTASPRPRSSLASGRSCRFTLIAETGRVRHFRALPETRLFSRHPNWDWRPIFVHLKWD